MTNGKVTYRELFEALRGLGYQEQLSTVAGKPAVILNHPRHPRATIFLPRVDPDEEVASMHVLAVRSTLTDFGLIREDPARELMDRIEASRKATSKT